MLARGDYCDSFTKAGNFIGREAHMLDDLEAGLGHVVGSLSVLAVLNRAD